MSEKRDFTVVVEVGAGAVGEARVIAACRKDEGEVGWDLSGQKSGAWRWRIGDGESEFDYSPTAERQSVADGEPHLLAFSVNWARAEVRLYYDGLNVAIYSVKGLKEVARGGAVESSEARVTIEERVLGDEEVAGLNGKSVDVPEERVGQLKVMAWNIWNGGREHGEVDGVRRVIEIIRDWGADVVAMQETYGSGPIIADALGYYFFLRSSNLSIMSRYPIGESFDLFQPFNFGGAMIQLSAAQQLAMHVLWIHYLPDYANDVRTGMDAQCLVAGEGETRHREIVEILKEMEPRLGEADERPVIMAGDYNSPSHLDWTARAAHLRGDLAVEWPVSKRMAEAGMGSMPTGRCMWTKRRIMGGPTRRFSPRLRIE